MGRAGETGRLGSRLSALGPRAELTIDERPEPGQGRTGRIERDGLKTYEED